MVIILNGPCGVGKTTLSKQLAKQLVNSVHIIGDEVHNFIVDSKINKEHIEVTNQNIVALTSNFLNYGFMNIIIDYVYEEESVLQEVVHTIQKMDPEVIAICITCSLKENIIRNKSRADADIMDEGRVKELNEILRRENNNVGILLDTSNLSIENSLSQLLKLIEKAGDPV